MVYIVTLTEWAKQRRKQRMKRTYDRKLVQESFVLGFKGFSSTKKKHFFSSTFHSNTQSYWDGEVHWDGEVNKNNDTKLMQNHFSIGNRVHAWMRIISQNMKIYCSNGECSNDSNGWHFLCTHYNRSFIIYIIILRDKKSQSVSCIQLLFCRIRWNGRKNVGMVKKKCKKKEEKYNSESEKSTALNVRHNTFYMGFDKWNM